VERLNKECDKKLPTHRKVKVYKPWFNETWRRSDWGKKTLALYKSIYRDTYVQKLKKR